MVGLWCYNQSGVTEFLTMRDPHYGRMCFKSSASTFSTAKNVEFLGLFYPILKGLIMKIVSTCAQDHNLEGFPREKATENV